MNRRLLICHLLFTGGGIYARSSYYSNSIAMANNSALVWKSYSSYSYEMDIHCMSNSTSSSTGSVIRTPYGNPLSATSCGVGCYRMYSSSSSLSSSHRGIYTCRIADSNGVYLDINFGIYPYNSRYSCKHAELYFKELCNVITRQTYFVVFWSIIQLIRR